jgi:hypothetical protein
MRPSKLPLAFACLGTFAACTSTTMPWPAAVPLLAQAPEDMPARLLVTADGLHGFAIGLGPGTLPDAVRTTIDAVAPAGELQFQGREWGPRGSGYRIEKHYRDGAAEHVRSVLVAADGAVLERWHTVPLADVPAMVLRTAMQTAPEVVAAAIVSGPIAEEHWLCTVRNRIGHTLLVTVGLDGRDRGTVRRLAARLDG